MCCTRIKLVSAWKVREREQKRKRFHGDEGPRKAEEVEKVCCEIVADLDR